MLADPNQCCGNCDSYCSVMKVFEDENITWGACCKNLIARRSNWGGGCSSWKLVMEEALENKGW